MSNTEKVLKDARAKSLLASKSAETAKNSAASLKKQVYNLPGFKRYDFFLTGAVQNRDTGRFLSVTERSKKFQLRHDNGKIKEMSKAAILELLPKPSKMLKEGKVKTPRTDSKKEIILALHKEGHDNKAIEKKTGYKSTTIFEAVNTYQITTLHNQGFDNKQIAEKLEKKEESIKSFIDRNIKHIK